MKNSKRWMLGALLAFSVMSMAIPAQSQINVFTDHQVIHMVQHGVNHGVDVPFPSGDYPYIGRIGLEYERKNWSYQLGYIHRSNLDLHGDEYFYDGVSLGIRYRHCIAYCN